MIIVPSARKVILPAAIVCSLVVGSVIAGNDVKSNEDQQASLLQKRELELDAKTTPWTEHDATILRKLISKKHIRFSSNTESDGSGNNRRLAPVIRQAAVPRQKADGSTRNDNAFARAMKASTTNNKQRGHGDRRALKNSELIPMELVAFQDSRFVQPPVLVSPEATQLAPGTQYMYSNEPLYSVYLDSPKGSVSKGKEGYYVDEGDLVAQVSGTCTRNDPNEKNDLYVGRAYCQYDYHFVDQDGNVEAQLTAEGPVQIGPYSTLSITGGTGVFRRTVGTIILETGDIGFEETPVFVPNEGLDLPSSYIVTAYVFMDSLDLAGYEGIL